MLAASVILARFWRAFAGSSWMVGVGDAVTTVATRKRNDVESFMVKSVMQ